MRGFTCLISKLYALFEYILFIKLLIIPVSRMITVLTTIREKLIYISLDFLTISIFTSGNHNFIYYNILLSH